MDDACPPSKRALVLASTRSMVQATDRALAVTVSLREQAERERFKEFLSRHPEFLVTGLSAHYQFDDGLLGRYMDEWDWEALSANRLLPWGLDLLTRPINRLVR